MSDWSRPPSYHSEAPDGDEILSLPNTPTQVEQPLGEVSVVPAATGPAEREVAPAIQDDRNEILGLSSSVEGDSTSQPGPNHGKPELPPVYARELRPNTTIKYSFSPIGPNSMLLLPPATAQDTRPRYYITVALNCFMPSSHITTIYRGADENAPRVGEFEMGIIGMNKGRVRVADRLPVGLHAVMGKRGSRVATRWTWKPQIARIARLEWDCTVIPFICTVRFAESSSPQEVARYRSHLLPVTYPLDESYPGVSQLDVHPDGQQCFDDILMSLLIVERRRLTPKTKTLADLEALFNY